MNENLKQLKYIISVLCVIVFQSIAVISQTPPPKPPPKPKPTVTVRPAPPTVKVFPPGAGVLQKESEDSEKSIAVDGKVNVSLPCILEGDIKINGWDRNEIRVFVKDGSRVSFNVSQKNKQTGLPVWVVITRLEAQRSERSSGECLYGNEIEIDVPRGASVNVKGQEIKTTIDSVRKASVKTIGGDISLRNIAEGIEAATYEGDVTVENSNGALTLESATGNIVAFETSPSEIGDIFKAKTNNGAIALQGLEHRQIEINSISGAISFNGDFLNGGLYSFSTSNGAITLAVPAETSCKISASYGFGVFNSEIPLKNIVKQSSKVQNLTALMGDGSATLNLTTNSGAIRIRKQK